MKTAQSEPNFAELEKIMLEVWQPEQALQRMTDNAEEMGLYKPQWVGLTDEEIDEAVNSCRTLDTRKYFRAIDAKLREKNNG